MNRITQSTLRRSLLALAVGGICLGIPALAQPPQSTTRATTPPA